MKMIVRVILACLGIVLPINLAAACTGNVLTQSALIAEINANLVNNATQTITAPALTQLLCDLTVTTFSANGNFTGTANTWVAIQTFNNGNFKLAGSVSGATTLQAQSVASGTITFPSVNDTVATLGTADQVVTGGANVTTLSLSTGNVTIDCGQRPLQAISNNGNFTITAPGNDGNCILLVTNGLTPGTVTFSGFSVGSNTGDSFDTGVTHKFSVFIWRVNGIAGYRVVAHQ